MKERTAPDEAGDEKAVFSGSVQKSVRDELEYLVLALLLKRPRCGTDIIKTIHGKFGLLLSPGTIYPLLHDLERRGLVQHEPSGKVKRYRPVRGMEEKIQGLLQDRINAKRMILSFLQNGE